MEFSQPEGGMRELIALRTENARLRAEAEAYRVSAGRLGPRLDDLLGEAPFVAWSWDPRRDAVTYLSPGFEHVWGRPRRPYLGPWSALLTVVHAEDRRRLGGLINQLPRGFDCEYRIVRPDGEVRWIHDRAFPTCDRGQALVIGVAVDVTERKQAEEGLRSSEEHYRTLSDSAAVGIAKVAIDGRLLHVNERLCELLGYSRDELLDLTFQAITMPEDLEANLALMRQALVGDRSHYRMEKRYRRRDGSFLWADLEASVVRSDAGQPLYVVSVVIDITERKQLQEQLLQSQKLESLGRLAGGVAHDFNNLLTVIIGGLDLATEGLPATEPRVGHLGSIRIAAERAAALTQQLLAFARRQVLAPSVVDVNHLLAETDRLLRHLIGADITLRTVSAPQRPLVRADPAQLQQVLVNLAVNARDAMPRGGTLTIVVQRTNRAVADGIIAPWVKIAVCDTGQGMDAETRSRVFEPFFTTKGERGTGMGLATCYGIVKQAGGDITVSSEIDRGTVFEVQLPEVAEPPLPASEPVPLAPERAAVQSTVLVVEDEELLRAVIVRALRSRGYHVLEARGGAEALAKLTTLPRPPDLLLTDVVMSGMSGPDLVAALRSRYPGIVVVYMSGYTEDAFQRPGMTDGAVSFLSKPFTPDVLVRTLRDALGR